MEEALYKEGDQINGQYSVQQIKYGGIGIVYLCKDIISNERYALKTVKDRYLSRKEIIEKLVSEIETWVLIGIHSNIVRCFRTEIINDRLFIVLEWVKGYGEIGVSLRSWLANGALDVDLALDFINDVCWALIYAKGRHAGIVHCDIKPENILISLPEVSLADNNFNYKINFPFAKITDFGLTKTFSIKTSNSRSSKNSKTIESRQKEAGISISGTPSYMAPEQWSSGLLDERTDIYATGCVLFEMLTGNRPYRAETINRLKDQHLNSEIPTLPKVSPIMVDLNQIILKCLSKKKSDRFQTFTELLWRLTEVYIEHFKKSPRVMMHPLQQSLETTERYAKDFEPIFVLDSMDEDVLLSQNACEYFQIVENAGIFIQLGRYQDAIKHIDLAIKKEPDCGTAYVIRGLIFDEMKHYESAISDFSYAIELLIKKPNAEYESNVRGLIINRSFDPNGQVDNDFALETLNKNLAWAYLNRSSAHIGLQKWNEAIEDCNQSIKYYPKYATTYNNRGYAWSQLGKFDQALSDLSKAISLSQDYAKAYLNRAFVYSCLEQYQEALNDCQAAVKFDPASGNAIASRGGCYFKLGKYDNAIKDLKASIKLDPNLDFPYFNLSSIFFNLKEYKQALPYLEKAVELGFQQAIEMLELSRSKIK